MGSVSDGSEFKQVTFYLCDFMHSTLENEDLNIYLNVKCYKED